jgi:integrase
VLQAGRGVTLLKARSNAMPSNSTTAKLPKPKKPYAKFPLRPHATGKWCKKIRGTVHYFGQWAKRENGELVAVEGDGWRSALAEYDRFIFEQQHGRPQSASNTDLSIGKLCNLFLDLKASKRDSKALSPSTFTDYKQAADLLAKDFFGGKKLVSSLTPLDFQALREHMGEKWKSPDRIAKFVTMIRSIFKYAHDSKLIDEPVSFGCEFSKPTAATFRRHRQTGGKRMFTAIEAGQLLNGKTVKKGTKRVKFPAASTQMKAMILLGLNCGFGNTDVGTLPLSAIDIKGKMIDFPRTKSAIERRCALWPETVAALKAVIAERPETKSELVFLTMFKNPWVNLTEKGTIVDSVGREFSKRLKLLGINGRRSLGFYSLRHTFQTVADGCLDFPAIAAIMGHAPTGMAARYREQIDDKRIKAVTDYVHHWLFPKPRARKAK